MTTPLQHWQEAEMLITSVSTGNQTVMRTTDLANIIAAAQLHATLALAGFTLLSGTAQGQDVYIRINHPAPTKERTDE